MSQADHINNLQRLCRVCGSRRNKGRPYKCQTYEDGLKEIFGIDISDDKNDIHPKNLCIKCQLLISDNLAPHDLIPIEWKGHHDEDDCWVCDVRKQTKQDTVVLPNSNKQVSKRRKADVSEKEFQADAVLLCDVNAFITCGICKGYLIDVATITECLHSYCKSCLVQYLQTNQTCPECGILIHETTPLQNIGFDTKLQDIIYKLVPGLADNESGRVKDFYAARNSAAPQKGTPSRPLTPAESADQNKFPPDDGRTWFHAHDVKIALCIEPKENDSALQQMPMKYVRCSMRLKVEHLAKFIKQKMSISDDLELTCNKQKLSGGSTLENIWLDTWKVKEAPMRLYYNKK